MRILLLVVSLIIFNPAQADYRVYELKIASKASGQARTVASTLDHLQYPAYYPLQVDENVTYVQSWKCRGNSSHFEPVCANPKAPNQGR